ncbi:MAG: LacI family DNA-binding transcriptional regulator [Planctomycetota bacterium]
MSIIKVAQIAGVSPSTVSRVINRDSRISEETVKRVRRAIEEVNYKPRPITDGRRRRRSRANRKTRTIEVCLGPLAAPSWEEFSGRVMGGVHRAAHDLGCSIAITSLRPDGQRQHPNPSARYDGVLYRGLDEECLSAISPDECCVIAFDPGPRFFGDSVEPNNRAVGQMACDYLVGRGRTNLAVLTNVRKGDRELIDREQAFHLAAASKEIEATALRFEEDAIAETKSLLTDFLKHSKPDGIFLPGEASVVSLVHRLIRELGYEIGRDCDLISNATELSLIDSLYPSIANIDVRPDAVGYAATHRIYKKIEGSTAAPQRTLLMPTLIDPRDKPD